MKHLLLFLVLQYYAACAFAQNSITDTVPDPAEAALQAGEPSFADPNKIYEYKEVEKLPEYPGGIEELNRFLKGAVSCPSEAWQLNVNGFVRFRVIIHEDGTLSDAEILFEFMESEVVREEAFRAVDKLAESADWSPALYKGQPVKVYYQLRVPFYCAHK